jgi:hypothetical protein
MLHHTDDMPLIKRIRRDSTGMYRGKKRDREGGEERGRGGKRGCVHLYPPVLKTKWWKSYLGLAV